MTKNIRHLYSATEKKMLPLRNRIIDAIYESADLEELTVAEVLGLLETIKLEIFLSELHD